MIKQRILLPALLSICNTWSNKERRGSSGIQEGKKRESASIVLGTKLIETHAEEPWMWCRITPLPPMQSLPLATKSPKRSTASVFHHRKVRNFSLYLNTISNASGRKEIGQNLLIRPKTPILFELYFSDPQFESITDRKRVNDCKCHQESVVCDISNRREKENGPPIYHSIFTSVPLESPERRMKTDKGFQLPPGTLQHYPLRDQRGWRKQPKGFHYHQKLNTTPWETREEKENGQRVSVTTRNLTLPFEKPERRKKTENREKENGQKVSIPARNLNSTTWETREDKENGKKIANAHNQKTVTAATYPLSVPVPHRTLPPTRVRKHTSVPYIN